MIGIAMFSKSSRHRRLLTGFLFALLALAIYYPSVPGALDFDDYPSVRDNLSIRTLWPIWDAMWAEKENPLAGRPIPNLSIAVNYAIHGLNPEGYRLVNIALHVVCAMLIFAIVRRTLLLAHPDHPVPWLVHCQMATPDDGQTTVASRAYVLSLLVTLLWLLHPLNSETVAYITQRTELCVALFLLLTVYCVTRAADSTRPARWRLLAVICCALGMLSKEVMVGAPLLVLFYDRCFIHSTWKETFRRSWLMYLGLAATWLILAGIMLSGPRTRSVGFHLGISVWDYLKAQAISLAWYLWLCIWPEGLRLTYWWGPAPTWQRAAPSGLLILMLLGLSLRWL
ncbi:MAG: hypothetical protein HC898_10400, partial [Phycisphaerales bacterium]|nr:hypothetical protein [Phycisphaerales bacterium]